MLTVGRETPVAAITMLPTPAISATDSGGIRPPVLIEAGRDRAEYALVEIDKLLCHMP